MPRQRTTDISTMFSDEIKQLQQQPEIEQLQREIEHLRLQLEGYPPTNLDQVASKLARDRGMLEIPLQYMRPYEEQPRQTITKTSVTKMRNALAAEGQYTPVILRRVADDDYLIFDGERRWRGAQQLGWSTLKCVLMESSQELFREIFLVNQYREDLNALDKAQSLLQILSHTTQMETEMISRLIRRAVRRLKRHQQAVGLAELISLPLEEQQQTLNTFALREEERRIFQELLVLQFNPVSVEKHLLPMLSLPQDLVSAIRTQELGCSQAKELAGLSASALEISEKEALSQRRQAREQVLQKQLSVAKTRKLVREIKKQYGQEATANQKNNQEEEEISTSVWKAVEELTEPKFAKIERNQLEKIQVILQEKLTQIEQLLQE